MAKKPARKNGKNRKPAIKAPARPQRLAAVVHAAPVVEEGSFKQKLATILRQNKTSGINAAKLSEATSEVRAGVMEELRKQGSQSQPFENVMLPLQRRRRMGMPLWVVGTLVSLLALVLLVWWASRPPAGAELALHRIQNAIESRNTAAFERLVDIPALTTSVVDQVFGQPAPDFNGGQSNVRADQLMADQFEAMVRAHLQNLIKPGQAAGLADHLHDQILAAVSAGRLPNEPGNLLGQLWQQLGGERLKIGRPHVAAGNASANRVVAELPLMRNDIDLDVALQLVLERHDGNWQLTDLPNLAQVMGLVDQTEASAASIEPASGPLPSLADNAPVTVDVLQAAKDKQGRVIARLNMANTSGLPVRGLDMALIIGDADGRPLKQVMLHETTPLAPTASVEKSYTVAIDTKNSREKYIAQLPLTALTVRVTLVNVKQ
ncbi:MAG TPA: DUF2939 domain-containing protein [Alphaproteobacteria bacterium]|nr:DUF2939 domain-containing protein [Alphaproteobacteria bacterium]